MKNFILIIVFFVSSFIIKASVNLEFPFFHQSLALAREGNYSVSIPYQHIHPYALLNDTRSLYLPSTESMMCS